MNSSRFLISLLFLLLQPAVAQRVGISDATCNTDDLALYEDANLKSAFFGMISKYNQTCTREQCKVTPDTPLEGFLNWNYGGPTFGMRRTCEARRNYKACSVKTTVRYIFDVEGLPIHGYIIENEKGVCFPPSCSDEDVHILEPNPGQCDPTTTACEIVSYEVDCPNNRVVTNSETCAEDKLPNTSPFFISRGVTELAIMADCANVFSGTGAPTLGLCTASTGTIEGSFTTSFKGFETDPTYIFHENSCAAAGGKVCLIDMQADYTISGSLLQPAIDEVIPIEEAGDIILNNEFIQFPRCVAKTCQENDMEEVMAQHLNIHFLNQFDLSCDLDSDNCNIQISNVNCGDFAQGPEETVTNVPTATPTKTITESPTKAPKETSTKTPTAEPKETSTKIPTKAPQQTSTSTGTINIPLFQPSSESTSISASSSDSLTTQPSESAMRTPSFISTQTISSASTSATLSMLTVAICFLLSVQAILL